MDSKTVHIHKTTHASTENLLFLIIPILAFLVAIYYFAARNTQSQNVIEDRGQIILGTQSENP